MAMIISRIILIPIAVIIIGCGQKSTDSKNGHQSSMPEVIISEYIESHAIKCFRFSKDNDSTTEYGGFTVSKFVESTGTVFLTSNNYETKWNESHSKNNFSATEIRFSIPECEFSTKEAVTTLAAIFHDDPVEAIKMPYGYLIIKSMKNGIQHKSNSGMFIMYSDTTNIPLKNIKHANELKKLFDSYKIVYNLRNGKL